MSTSNTTRLGRSSDGSNAATPFFAHQARKVWGANSGTERRGSTPAKRFAAAGRLRAERPSPTAGLTASLLELHARAMTIAVRHARAVERFVAVHDDVDLALVPTEATDVHDLEGLRLIGDRLGR